jgi:hypothetical protein
MSAGAFVCMIGCASAKATSQQDLCMQERCLSQSQRRISEEQQIKKVPDSMVEVADMYQQLLTLATSANQGFVQGH